MSIVYKTDRLVLKSLDSTSASMVLDYIVRNKEYFEVSEGVKNSEYYTLGMQEKFLEHSFNAVEKGHALILWIFEKGKDDKIIGMISATGFMREVFQSCFLGYKLDKDVTKNGYMTEAIKKSVDILFNEYKFHRIQAVAAPSNLGSLRVLEKCGFEVEGTARKFMKLNGQWRDHLYLSLINEDYTE